MRKITPASPLQACSRSKHLSLFSAAGLLLLALAGCGTSSRSGVQVSALKFDYGDVAIGTQVRRIAITVKNTTSGDVTVSPTLTGSGDFVLAGDVSCSGTLAASGTCSVIAVFSPTAEGSESTVLDLGMSQDNQRIPLVGNGVQLAPGTSIVSATDNPLVARYTYSPASSGNVSVQFGPDTAYGLRTMAWPTQAGVPASILVAGMRSNSTYHMQAIVAADDGTIQETDADQSFTTSNFPQDRLPSVSVTSNGTPQSGVELMNPALAASGTYLQAYALDLEGNVIWGYDYPDRTKGSVIQPFKLLPNGNVIALIGLNSAVSGPPPAGELIVVREIDLAGVPVRQISLAQLNAALPGAGFPNLTLLDFHHEVTVLPNGHWLVMANTIRTLNGLPNQAGSTDVLGDVVVDLDTSLNPVWVWNELDHLDPARAPGGYPDWTHSNAILYVPGDGNILVSSRHQSWVMKVDYRNGTGTGNVVWRLGYQGDFKLVGGTEPQDWFYGQHQPSFIGANTTGTFQLTLMDNGFLRQLSPGGTPCTKSGAQCYSTVPIMTVDENAKAATLQWRDSIDPSTFAIWGGGTTPLANGNLEFDLCGLPNYQSEIDEVTPTGTPQVVWSLKVTGQNDYRANRTPSLYQGVQW